MGDLEREGRNDQADLPRTSIFNLFGLGVLRRTSVRFESEGWEMTEEQAIKICFDHDTWRASFKEWPETPNPHDFQLVTYCKGFLSGLSYERKRVEGLLQAVQDLLSSCKMAYFSSGRRLLLEKIRDELSAYREKRGEGK